MLVSFMGGRNYPAALAFEAENEHEEELCNAIARLVNQSGGLQLRFCDTKFRNRSNEEGDADEG